MRNSKLKENVDIYKLSNDVYAKAKDNLEVYLSHIKDREVKFQI